MNISNNFIIQEFFKNNSIVNLLKNNWENQELFYYTPQITFREVPDKISLTIPTLCYEHCSQDCNSKFCWVENWKDKFELLDEKALISLIQKNQGISCITIMTSTNFSELEKILKIVKEHFSNIETALYIGKDWEELINSEEFRNFNFKVLDYIKIGRFKKEFGPLDNKNTNQRFYCINHKENYDIFNDITDKFIEKLL